MADAILEDAARRYNVPLGVLEGIAAAEGHSWNLIHPGGEVGRFGLHPVHAAEIKAQFGVDWKDLPNRPDVQVAYWVPRIAEAWHSAMALGKGVTGAAWDVVNKVQAPQQQYRQREVNSILQYLGEEGGADMVQQTSGVTIPPEIDRLLEDYWENKVSSVMAQIQGETAQSWDEGVLEKEAEMRVIEALGPKDYWKARTARTEFGVDIEATTGMTPYQTATLGLQQQQFNLERDLAELDYNMRVKGWPIEKVAAEFANRVSAASAGATLAQTAEQIRTSQRAWRAPPPNVPGGYQPLDVTAFTKYGLTAPKPMPVQPVIHPDPWAEIQRGMGVVGPPAIPEMDFPPFPGVGGGVQSAIIQAYNSITGGGVPTPSATPDILTRDMQPSAIQPSGPPGISLAPVTAGAPSPFYDPGYTTPWEPGMSPNPTGAEVAAWLERKRRAREALPPSQWYWEE